MAVRGLCRCLSAAASATAPEGSSTSLRCRAAQAIVDLGRLGAAALQGAAAVAEKRGWELSKQREQTANKMLADNGMTVHAPDAALMSAMNKIGDTIAAEWLKAAGADGDLADAAAGGGVAVGAEKGGARFSEALEMHLVADPVAGAGVHRAELRGHGLQIKVIVAVFEADLLCVVVDIRHRQVGSKLADAEGFKLQKRHGAGRVVHEGLIDPDGDFFTRSVVAFPEVRLKHFFNDVPAHDFPQIKVAP